MNPLPSITIAGEPVRLVRSVPIGLGGNETWFSAAFTLPLSLDAGLTNREERIRLGARFRLHGNYQILLRGAELPAWRAARQAMGASRLAIPFWPAAGFTRQLESAWWLVVDQASGAATAYADADCPESVSGSQRLVPVLLARFAKPPQEKRIDADRLALALEWQSDGEATWIAATAGAWTAGPVTAAGDTDVFPLRADWSETPTGFDAVMPFALEQYGQRREQALAAYDQPALRSFQQRLTLAREGDWQRLLAFAGSHSGAAFWIDAGTTETRLAVPAAATDTELTLADLTLYAQRAVVLDDGRQRRVVLGTDTDGNPMPLTGPVGRQYAAGTPVRPAALVRFAQTELVLDWTSPAIARAQVRFLELGWELLDPEDESIGVTHGRLAPVATLFEVTIGEEVWRYTNYERALSDGDNTWTPEHLDHDAITEKLNLEDISTTISGRWDAAGPFARLWPMTLESPLYVRIIEATLGDDGLIASTVTLFRGEVTEPDFDGPKMSLKCEALASLLGRSVPAMTISKRCRWIFCQGGCGAHRADFEITATVVAGITAGTTLTVQSTGAAWTAGTFAAHRFANGELTQAAPLATCLIADSTTPDGGGVMTLTLSLPMTLALGTTVKLLPGCDGDFATCTAFGQTATFGGAPWIPPRNLLEFQPTSSATMSGKK